MRSRGRHTVPLLASVLIVLLLVLPTLIVVPIGFSSRSSFQFPPENFSLRWYRNFVAEPEWRDSLVNSVVIGLVTSLLATAVGTAAAVGLNRWRTSVLRGLVRGSLVLPMIIPGIILAVGIYAVFSRLGLVGTTIGFVLAHTVVALPFVVITVGVNLSSVDPRLGLAAAGLGATPWAAFRQVTLPLITPGVAAGALFAFITSFDEVVISLFIKSPFKETLPVKMYASMTESIDPTIASAATIVLLLTTVLLVLFAVAGRLARRRLADGSARA